MNTRNANHEACGDHDLRRAAAKILFISFALLCLSPWGSPPLALGIGVVLALAIGNPFRKATQNISKWLLQCCVVFLGFSMNLTTVLRVGATGAGMAAMTIAVTLTAGYLLGRCLRLRPEMTLLLSAGTAICGGSAIAAVGSAMDSEQSDMTVAMGTVFMLNAAALYLFPVVGHWLGLSENQFGLWAGVGIHDISSVVGAASRYGGAEALQTATAVKLSRALWIIPLTLGITFAAQRSRFAGTDKQPTIVNATFGFDPIGQKKPRKLQIPYFIGLFLLASVLRSAVPAIAHVAPALTHVATIGLTLTLFLIGSALSRQTLIAVGWKALAHGMALWVLISALSLLFVKAR
jgi:uncharacterized integral membrane protein (TIGR00698 family)